MVRTIQVDLSKSAKRTSTEKLKKLNSPSKNKYQAKLQQAVENFQEKSESVASYYNMKAILQNVPSNKSEYGLIEKAVPDEPGPQQTPSRSLQQGAQK